MFEVGVCLYNALFRSFSEEAVERVIVGEA